MTRYILDVRTKGEYDCGCVDGAIHHDIMDMMYGKFPDIDKGAQIVVYCESGNRSMMACNMLAQNGFTCVTDGGGIDNLLNK